mmetsp:Transcript_63189/g.199901  ORF Transcript_63189/g.199901 Transcript_63189/m.199901 type:complete len:251 (-) Transcript_63189:2475-3227(-)
MHEPPQAVDACDDVIGLGLPLGCPRLLARLRQGAQLAQLGGDSRRGLVRALELPPQLEARAVHRLVDAFEQGEVFLVEGDHRLERVARGLRPCQHLPFQRRHLGLAGGEQGLGGLATLLYLLEVTGDGPRGIQPALVEVLQILLDEFLIGGEDLGACCIDLLLHRGGLGAKRGLDLALELPGLALPHLEGLARRGGVEVPLCRGHLRHGGEHLLPRSGQVRVILRLLPLEGTRQRAHVPVVPPLLLHELD